MAAAAILREALPSLDEPIVTYLDRYIYDAGEDPTVDVMDDVVRPMLESAVICEPSDSPKRLALPTVFESSALLWQSVHQRGQLRASAVLRVWTRSWT